MTRTRITMALVTGLIAVLAVAPSVSAIVLLDRLEAQRIQGSFSPRERRGGCSI
jgi:hypothetical protein